MINQKFAYVKSIDCGDSECFELFIGIDMPGRYAVSKGHFSSIEEAKQYAFKQGVSADQFESKPYHNL